jgi:hypothetical protein
MTQDLDQEKAREGEKRGTADTVPLEEDEKKDEVSGVSLRCGRSFGRIPD